MYIKNINDIIKLGDLMDQFERFKLLIDEKFENIMQKKVLIIGLGGVGSYALEALIRSGISDITIIDNDVIDITNLNRQLMTTLNNIGKYKVDVLEDRIKSINPNCKIKKIKEFITKDNLKNFFDTNLDYIIDACDTIQTKKEIIKFSVENNIKLISCMGTGNKLDPSKLKVIDIRKTSYDPIAKILRKYIKDEKINKKIMVVCSDEICHKKIDKIIPSNSFVPATAGLLCASYIINDIIENR